VYSLSYSTFTVKYYLSESAREIPNGAANDSFTKQNKCHSRNDFESAVFFRKRSAPPARETQCPEKAPLRLERPQWKHAALRAKKARPCSISTTAKGEICYTPRRNSRHLASVIRSVYLRSPPMGTPRAIRVTVTPCSFRSFESNRAVVSPGTLGFVAKITSSTG
jgi:hypothetical protein